MSLLVVLVVLLLELLQTTRVIAGCLNGELWTDDDDEEAWVVAVFGVRFIIKSFDTVVGCIEDVIRQTYNLKQIYFFFVQIIFSLTSSYAGIFSSFNIDQIIDSFFHTNTSNILVSIEFKWRICSRVKFSSLFIKTSIILIKLYASMLKVSSIQGNNSLIIIKNQ